MMEVWLKMVLVWFLCLLLAVALAQKDSPAVSVDCSKSLVTVRWRLKLLFSQKVDVSKALLGTCLPSSVSEDTLVFYASLQECGFLKKESESRVTYSNLLVYEQIPGLSFISESVRCVFDVPWSGKAEFSPLEREEVTFNLQLMNGDFSGPALLSTFTLGSSIPIKAEVENNDHRPLQIFLDSCFLAAGSEIQRTTPVHPIIANSGCLMASREGSSTFLPRRKPNEILLNLQASQFALGKDVFFHCDMVVRDLQSVSLNQKACHYQPSSHRWMLLDNPSQSYVCSCCESTCRVKTDNNGGLSTRKVLGPFTIVDQKLHSNSSMNRHYGAEPDPGVKKSPVWLLVVVVTVVLVIITGAVAMSYYLCCWRGGRLGYRPSRDLLNKY